MKKLRWGILGAAKIAGQWLIPAMQESEYAEVVAIGSRDSEKARAFAQKAGIPKAHGSYQAVLDDPEVDAIYNPMPNHLHVSWSLRAIEAGKHVLCEKPLGLDANDIQPLLTAAEKAPHLVIMEAFMYRFHPQWVKIKEMLTTGELGQVNAVNASFTYNNQDPDNVRNMPGIGGGGLLDIGCYCVSAARFAFGREPVRVASNVDIDSRFGVDRHASVLLDFGPGMGTFICSTQSESSQTVSIFGERGNLVVENPFFRRDGVPSRLILTRDGQQEVINVGIYNHYVDQIDAFSKAALNGQPAPTPLSDALANMKVLDAIFKSAEAGTWVKV